MISTTEKTNDEYNKTMLTDLYQLTMNAAYYDNNKDEMATFDLFVRTMPEEWGYYITAGVEEAVDYATNIKFTKSNLEYLASQNIFSKEYLEFLKDFKFEGEMYAIKEGTPITTNTPIIRVTAKRTQAQFLESTLLNIINYQTMIASKASRIVHAADGKDIVEFGLRRAQGEDAAIKGARATYIAGAVGTSNVAAGEKYGIPISGTQAHSYIMSFPTEIEAFRSYAKTFPNSSVLLIDTYNTLNGAKNAIIVAKELEENGHKLKGVRIDSGDLAENSKKVREMFDNNGLDYVKIVVSNDLNEKKIMMLNAEGAKIDAYGVGTEMITAKPVAAISGVYKIVEDNGGPKIKLSEGKKTYPGMKQVYRVETENGYNHDILAIDGEYTTLKPLLEKVVEDGHRISSRRELKAIREYCLKEVAKLPAYTKELSARPYELRISEKLEGLVDELTEKYGGGNYDVHQGV